MSLGNARTASRRACRRGIFLFLHLSDGTAASSVQTWQHHHRCQRRQFTLSSRIYPHRTRLKRPPLLWEVSCKKTRRSFTTSPLVNEPETSSSTSASSSAQPFESPHGPHIPWPKHANPTPYEIFNLPRTASPKEVK